MAAGRQRAWRQEGQQRQEGFGQEELETHPLKSCPGQLHHHRVSGGAKRLCILFLSLSASLPLPIPSLEECHVYALLHDECNGEEVEGRVQRPVGSKRRVHTEKTVGTWGMRHAMVELGGSSRCDSTCACTLKTKVEWVGAGLVFFDIV